MRDLVGHVTGEQLWVPWLMRGSTLDEAGGRFSGDVLGVHPARVWLEAAGESRSAVHRPGALDGGVLVSSGRIPAAEYVWQLTIDLTVHAWGLACGIGGDDRLDEPLAAAVYPQVEARVRDWQGSGLFARPVEAAESEGTQDRLLALTGRRGGR